MVDENGEPMVVYHGTWVSRGENYDKWNPEKEAPFYQFSESDNGIHFGTEEQAEYIIARKRKLFEEEQGDYTGFSHIYASFLNIKNMYRTYDAGLKWDKVISEANKKADEIKLGLINEGEMLAKPVIEKAKREVEHIKSVDDKKLESVVNSIVERIVSVNGNS